MDKGYDGKRADLVTAMRSFADGEGVDHPTLTRFMKSEKLREMRRQPHSLFIGKNPTTGVAHLTLLLLCEDTQ